MIDVGALNLHEFYAYLAAGGQVRRLLELARDEDLGVAGDITSQSTIPIDARGAADLVFRAPGVVAGLEAVPGLLEVFAGGCEFSAVCRDGQEVGPRVIGTLRGPMRSVLAVERTLLNLVGRLSGIATLTARHVAAAGPAGAKVCDTRKTTPGLRALEKYAVRCGGGVSHRLGLDDAVLIKDNHLAGVPIERLGAVVSDAAWRARAARPADLRFVEVEVDTLDQLREVLAVAGSRGDDRRVDWILLDNMTPDQLRAGAALRRELSPATGLEASGGVNLGTIAAIAATGVDRVSVGALTHQAVSIDVALDVREGG